MIPNDRLKRNVRSSERSMLSKGIQLQAYSIQS